MNWISKLLGKNPDVKPSAAPARPLPAPLAGPRVPLPQDPPETWVEAICQAPDKATALAWTANLQGDRWLGQVARQARGAETRYAEARRIESDAVLEQVAHACRDKDKRVYRHCTDLLLQRREAQVREQRTTEITGELQALLATVPLPSTRLFELKKQVEALGHAGLDACRELLEQGMTRLRLESEARRDLQAKQRAAAALAAECEHADWPWDEQVEAWRVRLEPLAQAAGLPAWLADEATARALKQSLGEIEARMRALTADADRTRICEQYLIELEQGTAPDVDPMAWDALPKPEHESPRLALEARWEALYTQSLHTQAPCEPAPAPQPARKPPRFEHDRLREPLEQLDLAIEQGHLAAADTLMQQIKSTLAGHRPDAALEHHLHDLHARLEALRGWARWGTGQAREHLIASARDLQSVERDVEELALAIPALREDWKRLNAHGPAAKGQWEHFDAALEQAYKPVAALRAEQAARQAEALAAKEALCAEWEAEVATMLQEQPDYKAIETRRTQMIAQWRASPQAGFRDERSLRKRFDALIGDIDSRLEAARTAECTRREQLIAAALALVDQPDLRLAMSHAKTLQGSWGTQGVRLKRQDEVKLWQRFRAACDAVFARQDALRAEQTTQRQERAQSRKNLLDTFEATLAGADAGGIKQALTRFRSEWDATNSHENTDRLDTRARELQQLAQTRLDDLHDQKNRRRFELLASKAALAERIEQAVLVSAPLDTLTAEVQSLWEAMPALPGKAENLLALRYATANRITPAELTAGLALRETLLLDLEMALDLPSPETYAAVRRERQMASLQRHFAADSTQQPDPEAMLLRWYATPALIDKDFDRRIALVIGKLAAMPTGLRG